jgi:hypothetical protein
MGNKLQKEKLEREAAARTQGGGLQNAGNPTAASTARADPGAAAATAAPTGDGDYSHYNNKLSINDFVLLKVDFGVSIAVIWVISSRCVDVA